MPVDETETSPPVRQGGPLFATDIKVTGQPLDPGHVGRIIKPRELVDIIELTPLNRSETILYNQLLAHAWNNIRTATVHKVLKASLRGSHESNDRLHEAFDRLMGAWAKIRALDPQTGTMATFRVHLLGTNKEEDQEDGYFYYTFPPDLLAVIAQSKAWATIKSHIMYTLRSKYSIRLYEMIERRIGLNKQYEEFTIDELRAKLGVPPDERRLQALRAIATTHLQSSDRFHRADRRHQARTRRREASRHLVPQIPDRIAGSA